MIQKDSEENFKGSQLCPEISMEAEKTYQSNF